jgi:hypothetical protein
MEDRQPQWDKEQFIARGYEIYETRIRPVVEVENHGRIVAIDVATVNMKWRMIQTLPAADYSLVCRMPRT